MIRIFSLIFVLLFSVNQKSSGNRFKIEELGFSFEEPDWYGVQNKEFAPLLKKYNWNVESAVKSVSVGSIEIIKYRRTSVDKDKGVFLTVSVGGLHKNLRDFNKLMAFEKNIKVNMPDLKILKPLTQVNISGKKALISSMSYTEHDGKGKTYTIFSKSLRVFMGSFVYSIYIQSKDSKDIKAFDGLVKTIIVTK